jgi:hypothetical protein
MSELLFLLWPHLKRAGCAVAQPPPGEMRILPDACAADCEYAVLTASAADRASNLA